MYECSSCGRMTDDYVPESGLCRDCDRKRNESQDERRHEGNEKHGKP